MRQATVTRKTAETDINLSLCLDGTGITQIQTGCGFLDHMLTLLARHGNFDLSLTCIGDTNVDDHHTVEDVGIVLGSALLQALGDKKGILRYGDMMLPMDEALVLCALDLSGRCYLRQDVQIPTQKVGSFDTELVREFWWAFARSAGVTLHFQSFSGLNSHHIIEAMFKAAGRALAKAVAIDSRNADSIPSTKGVL